MRRGHLARRPECWASCPHCLQVAQVPRASVPRGGRARHARLVSGLLFDGDADRVVMATAENVLTAVGLRVKG